MAVEKTRGTAEMLKSAHPFQQDGFAQSAPPVFGGDAHQHGDGATGGVVVVDGAETGDFPGFGGGDDIQVAAVERGGLDVFVPGVVAIVV